MGWYMEFILPQAFSANLTLYAVPLLFTAPAIGLPVWGIKSPIVPSADPEIYFPSGTELILRVKASVKIGVTGADAMPIRSLSSDEVREADNLLGSIPDRRAKLGKHPADLVNVLMFGSRRQIDLAFHAAGWSTAERKSPLALYRMYRALTRRKGYKKAPMNAMTLAGIPSDITYQKSLDTVEKRHHVRLWREPSGKNLWLGTASQDVAFRFQQTHWTHVTDPRIDNERAKVLNDLAFTGCIDAAGLMAHVSPKLAQNQTAEFSIVTDGEVGVVRLNDCSYPTIMSGPAESGSQHSTRLSSALVSFRDDLVKANIAFTIYNTVKFATDHFMSPPVSSSPSIEAPARELDWLRSLSTEEQASAQSRKPGENSVPVQ